MTHPPHAPAEALRIGLLTPEFPLLPDDDSGIGHHYRTLATALAELGHHVHVVHATARTDLPPDSGLPAPEGYSREVLRVTMPRILGRWLRGRWTIIRLVERYRCARQACDGLHRAAQTHGLQMVEASSFAALPYFYLRRRRRLPVATRVATTDRQQLGQTDMQSRALRMLADAESDVIRRSDFLLTHTVNHRDNICALEHLRPERFTVIPHGITGPANLTASPVTPGRRVLFLYVGAFNHRKGTDVLFAALPQLLAACPEADFCIVGRQYQSTLWADFQKAHGATFADRVRCPGPVAREELARLYRECDVVVAPSRYESFGLVYAEGMSYGKPVIGCRCGGVPEVVQDQVTGFLNEPGDVIGLTRSLVLLARDPGLRTRMGSAGRRDFEARFSARRMAERSAEFYRQALAALFSC